MKNIVWPIIICLCSACSTLPNSQNVSDFGDAAAAGATLLQNAVTANRTIALRIGEEDQATRFLLRQPSTLSDRPSVMLSKVRLKPRLEALEALQGYAKALKTAADQGVIDSLEQAATKLGTAATGVVTVASPAAAPIAGPAIKIASRGFGILLGNAYAAEIQAIIVAHDADVQAVVDALETDLGKVADVLRSQSDDFEKQRKLSLLTIQQDPAVDRLKLYYEYKAARQDISSIKAQVAAIQKYKDLLDGLAKAHHALAQGSPDARTVLDRFASLTADLTALATALKKESK